VEFHVGPVAHAPFQGFVVDILSSAQVDHCSKTKEAHACEQADHDVESDPVGCLALPIGGHLEKHDALLASVCAIQDVILAVLDHGSSAGVVSIHDIGDGSLGVACGTLRSWHTDEGAPSIPTIWELVMKVLCIIWTLGWTLLVFGAVLVHTHGNTTLAFHDPVRPFWEEIHVSLV